MCNLSATALTNVVPYVVLLTCINWRAFLSWPPALTCRFVSLFVLLAPYLDVEWVKQVLASIVESLPECTYTALNHCNYVWVCLSSHATQYTQCANGVLMFPHLVQIRPFFCVGWDTIELVSLSQGRCRAEDRKCVIFGVLYQSKVVSDIFIFYSCSHVFRHFRHLWVFAVHSWVESNMVQTTLTKRIISNWHDMKKKFEL